MVVCELCGNEVNKTTQSKIAGTQMNVCDSCKKHGTSLNSPGPKSHTFRKKIQKTSTNLDVKENAPSLINAALAKKNLTVHHLARTLNIKESSLLKYTTGKLKLDVDTARKIENFLEISLVEEVEDMPVDAYLADDEDNTSHQSLGDLIKNLKK